MSDSIIIKSKIKESAEGMNVGSDFTEKLDSKVKDLIKEASERAKANGRKTLQAKDL